MATNAMHLIGGSQREENLIFFGTDGIRGKAETLLTNELVRKIGFWTWW